MTTDHLHLDDEALSAVLDGEADAEESAHADACEACRARLGQLRDASVLVGTPVPAPDPARREAAIAAALGATDRVADVAPMRRRTVPRWLAAAAALVLAVVGISLVSSRGGDDADMATSGGDDSATDMTATADAAPEAQLFMAAPIDGGDIGAVDLDALRATVEGAIAGTQREAAAGVASDEDAGNDGDTSGGASAPPDVAPCEEELRAAFPELGPLLYRATGTLDREAVAVLAFEVPPDSISSGRRADRWVYVVSADACTVRNQQTYSPE